MVEEDEMAPTPLPAPMESKPPKQPRWQKRQQDRQRYLSSSLATRIGSSSTPSSISPTPSPVPPSPSPLPQELAHTTGSDQRRQSDLTSTSLHYGEGAATHKRVSNLTSTSAPTHSSLHARSRSLPSDLFSQPSTTNTWSSITSASWLTCTDRETCSKQHEGLDLWPARMASPNDGDDQEPKKFNNVFDVMLSAFDRKKKRNATSPLQATQAPSTESLFPHRAACVYDPRKLQPRGGAERQDFSHLRRFLNANRARPEERAKPYEPKSEFEWENTDDEELDSKVSQIPRKDKKQQKHSTKDSGYEGGESRGIGRALGGVKSDDGEGDAEVNWGAGRSRARTEISSGGESTPYDFGATSTATQAIADQSAANSPDMIKAFEDPVWKRGYQLQEQSGDDRDSRRQSEHRINSSRGSSRGSSSKASSARTRLKLALQPEKNGSGFLRDPAVIVASSPRESVSKDARKQDASMQATIERKPVALPLPQITPVSPLPTMSTPTSFGVSSRGSSENTDSPSVGRKTSKFEACNVSETSIGQGSRKQHPSAASSPIDSIPNFFKRVARVMSNRDMSIAEGNAFAQEEARKLASPRPEDSIYTGEKKGDNTTLCYSGSPTPSRFHRGAEKMKISPSLPSAPQLDTRKNSPSLSSPPQSLYGNSPASPSSSFTNPPSRGLPAGPWEADWNDGVEWARNELKKHAKREAKQARDPKREMKEEKRLRKLNAAKDAVRRQSQLGMVPKKPLENITEDEFELVGEAALAADISTPTTTANLLGALFTKMQGSKEERKKRVNEIGHSLDNHASLHMLSKTDSNTVDEGEVDSNKQYNDTLRMLEGETLAPQELIGLGILSAEEEERAEHNRLMAKMSYEDFRAMKAKEQIPRKPLPGQAKEPPSPRTWPSQEAAAIRPLTTIKELDREHTASPGSDKTIRAARNRSISPSIYSTDDPEDSEHLSGQSTQIRQDIRNFSPGVHRYYEDDAVSVASMESDAIPPPLNVPKPRVKHSATRDSSEHGIGNRPAKVPILHVSKSSQHLQPTESKLFIPRRNSEFHNKIREQSRVQAGKIRNHPALRVATDQTVTSSRLNKFRSHPALRTAVHQTTAASYYPDDHNHGERLETMAMHARVDSGIGTNAGEVADEGYSTSNIGQQEFARSRGSPTTACMPEVKKQSRPRKPTLIAPDNTGAQQGFAESRASPTTGGVAEAQRQSQRRPTLMTFENTGSQPATGIDLNALRREVGLDAAQLPAGPQPKHPNHPFTWHHEKVMCYGVHNPLNLKPPTPTIPQNQPVNMTSLDSKHFSNSPTKGKIVGVKVCTSCGAHCCRFAHLAHLSKRATNKDVAEENMRMKAEQRVDKLRCYYPNGIEEYDTFLTCLNCERKICPGCATKCMERLCGAIVCTDCTPESGVCPVHAPE